MKWTVARARRRFAELVRSAAREPQAIYNRDRLVAAVVDPETFAQLESQREEPKRSVGDAFAELRDICDREEYTLEVPARRDRESAFASDE